MTPVEESEKENEGLKNLTPEYRHKINVLESIIGLLKKEFPGKDNCIAQKLLGEIVRIEL